MGNSYNLLSPEHAIYIIGSWMQSMVAIDMPVCRECGDLLTGDALPGLCPALLDECRPGSFLG